MDALRCHRRPEPTPILMELVDQRLIRSTPDARADGVSCFYLRELIELRASPYDTVTALAVCAFDENYPDYFSDVAQEHGYWNLYDRGPGTSPGQIISVYVSMDEQERTWMRANDSRMDATLSRWGEGTLSHLPPRPWTEISCNRIY